MTSLLMQVVILIVDSLAGFLSILFLLRFYMQMFRVPFNNPIGTLVLQLTNWLIVPFRRVIPGVLGWDAASFVAAFLMQTIATIVVIVIHLGFQTLPPESLMLLILSRSVIALLRANIYLVIGLLVLQAVLSWVNPYAPIYRTVNQMTQPILGPLRQIIPPVANLDLSPLIAILLAQIILIFL